MGETAGSIVGESLPGASRVDDSPNTADIREGIEGTRAEMTETISEIQEKLSPTNIKEQVKESVREGLQEAKIKLRAATIGKVETMMYQTGNSIWDTVKQNPVPSALAGLGLAWLFMNRRSASRDQFGYEGRRGSWGSNGDREQRSDNGYPHRQSEGEGGTGEVLQKVQDKAGQLANQTQQKVGEWVDDAKFQARRVEDRFQTLLQDNPVALGAVALTLGTAIGLALPRTHKEDQLMGEARDTLVDKAQDLAGGALKKVEGSVGELQQSQQH